MADVKSFITAELIYTKPLLTHSLITSLNGIKNQESEILDKSGIVGIVK